MMQQTETYQLNLIETSDTFSPAPLNENAQKLESALTAARTEAAAGIAAGDAAEAQARASADAAEAQARASADAAEAQTRASADAAEANARAAADAALGQRVTALELHKLAVGTYTGIYDSESSSSSLRSQTISLGFTPRFVLVKGGVSHTAAFDQIAVAETPVPNPSDGLLQIVDGGFWVSRTVSSTLNAKGKTYPYIALR